jgi:hypothetical protein
VAPADYSVIDTAASTDDENGEVNMEAAEPPAPILNDPVEELNRMLAEPQLYSSIEEAATTGIPVNAPLVAPVPVPMTVPSSLLPPTRPHTPAEELQPRGPMSFQLVSGIPQTDTVPLSSSTTTHANFHDRAAEIAERIASQ